MAREPREPMLSMRLYLLIKAMETGASFHTAWEAVASTLMSFPPHRIDPTLRYYDQWEALHARQQERTSK